MYIRFGTMESVLKPQITLQEVKFIKLVAQKPSPCGWLLGGGTHILKICIPDICKIKLSFDGSLKDTVKADDSDCGLDKKLLIQDLAGMTPD